MYNTNTSIPKCHCLKLVVLVRAYCPYGCDQCGPLTAKASAALVTLYVLCGPDVPVCRLMPEHPSHVHSERPLVALSIMCSLGDPVCTTLVALSVVCAVFASFFL